MYTIKLKNVNGLVPFLDSKKYIYDVVQDGWAVSMNFFDLEDIFKVGKEFGQYLAANPTLFTIEELEQRNDLPTAY